jgi:hypothetical protein
MTIDRGNGQGRRQRKDARDRERGSLIGGDSETLRQSAATHLDASLLGYVLRTSFSPDLS